MKLKIIAVYLLLLVSITSSTSLQAAHVAGNDRAVYRDNEGMNNKSDQSATSRVGKKILIGVSLIGGLTWLWWYYKHQNGTLKTAPDMPPPPSPQNPQPPRVQNQGPARGQVGEQLQEQTKKSTKGPTKEPQRSSPEAVSEQAIQQPQEQTEKSKKEPTKEPQGSASDTVRRDELFAQRLQDEENAKSAHRMGMGQLNENDDKASLDLAFQLQEEELSSFSSDVEQNRGVLGGQKEKDINELSQEMAGPGALPSEEEKLGVRALYEGVAAFEQSVVPGPRLTEAEKGQQQEELVKTMQELLYNNYQVIVGKDRLRAFLSEKIKPGCSCKGVTKEILTNLPGALDFSSVMLTDRVCNEFSFPLQMRYIKKVIQHFINDIKSGKGFTFDGKKLYEYAVLSTFDRALARQMLCYIQLIHLNSKIIKGEITPGKFPEAASWQEWMDAWCKSLPDALKPLINMVHDDYASNKFGMRDKLSLLYSGLTGEVIFAKKSLFEAWFDSEIVFFTPEEMALFGDKNPFDLVDELRPDKFVPPSLLDEPVNKPQPLMPPGEGHSLGGNSGPALSKKQIAELRSKALGKK